MSLLCLSPFFKQYLTRDLEVVDGVTCLLTFATRLRVVTTLNRDTRTRGAARITLDAHQTGGRILLKGGLGALAHLAQHVLSQVLTEQRLDVPLVEFT